MFGADFLKKAQAMQEKMAAMQQDLAGLTVTGTAGGGLVTVTLSGTTEVRSVHLDPALLKTETAEMIEDLVAAATNDALNKARMLASREMARITGIPADALSGLPGL